MDRKGAMNCREVAERASDYIDGAGGLLRRLRVRAHLFACGDCARFVTQLRRTRDLVRRSPMPPVEAAREDELVNGMLGTPSGSPSIKCDGS